MQPKGNQKNKLPLHDILKTLSILGIASVLVEGGATLFSEVIEERLVDKFLVFIAPKIYGNGLNAFSHLDARIPPLRLRHVQTRQINGDILIEGTLHDD